MTTRESNLWKWLSKFQHSRLMLTRIENTVGVGTSDVQGVFKGVQFWIELKSAAHNHAVKITVDQVLFLEQYCRCGGNGYVLTQTGSRRYLFHSPYAFRRLLAGVPPHKLHGISLIKPHATQCEIFEAIENDEF